MTRPQRFLVRMSMFLAAVVAVAGLLFPPLRDAFMANAPLNGLILGVLLLGVGYNFRQVLLLYPEVSWIEHFRQTERNVTESREPRLLAPMATMLSGRRDSRLSLSTLSMRSLLDGIASRLDEAREISRYTIGLLIFLGLLGTFWGLLATVSSIGSVISGMSVGGGDIAAMFGELKHGLEEPMKGMGTAFSSSLFGLAGSLVLGFLDLQAGQAQNRFYNDLEDWLSSLTKLSSGALGSVEGDQAVPAYVEALLEQTAESLENLQRTLARGEDSRTTANTNLTKLTERLSTLTDQMRAEQEILLRLAKGQDELRPALAKMADAKASGGMDETTRAHIRNLDIHVARMVEELPAGRDELIQQVRSEIKLLARTIAAASGGDNRPGT
ncbi:MAG: flagellar motor protein MotA [Rhodospirillales bacterium]|nr:flagellar motor protein MotA [Rhodospirillales bacterium]